MKSRITRFFPFTLFFLFTVTSTVAQKNQDDVLYLKNGWILRGKIVFTPADTSVTIQTYDRNTFVFAPNQIQEIRQERPVRNLNVRYRRRGFAHYTELGALAARNTTSNQTTTSAFTFHTVNGYKFSPPFFLGVGTGLDLYATQTFVPLFASIRGDIYHKDIIVPYYYIDGGYGFNATTNDAMNVEFNGGLHFAIGLGAKILFNNNAGFLLSIGYYLQETSSEQNLGGVEIRQEENYNRVAVRAGFSF